MKQVLFMSIVATESQQNKKGTPEKQQWLEDQEPNPMTNLSRRVMGSGIDSPEAGDAPHFRSAGRVFSRRTNGWVPALDHGGGFRFAGKR